MFYRFVGEEMIYVNLFDVFKGNSLFVCGGHPSLLDEPLHILSKHGINILAMNNTASIIRPHILVTADRPECYSKSLLIDPAPMKFGRLAFHHDKPYGMKWHDCPNTYFYGTDPDIEAVSFLNRSRFLPWWKNVFIIMIKIAYMLGFRRLYFCGTGFSIDNEEQYAYETKLSEGEVVWNKKCYNMVMRQFRDVLPILRNNYVELFSCTKESAINSFVDYMSLESAVIKELKDYPAHDTINVRHSSFHEDENSGDDGDN